MLARDVVAFDDTVRSRNWYSSGPLTHRSSTHLDWAGRRILVFVFLWSAFHGRNGASREAAMVASAGIHVAHSVTARGGTPGLRLVGHR